MYDEKVGKQLLRKLSSENGHSAIFMSGGKEGISTRTRRKVQHLQLTGKRMMMSSPVQV
jgi:hypothetical protein